MHIALWGVVLLSAGLAACGEGTTPTPGPDGGVTPLIPVAVGHTWTYRVTSDTGVVSQKVQTITGTAASGANMGYRFETTKGRTRETISVQGLVDGVLRRYEELSYKDGVLIERVRYTPHMVRIDANQVAAGATYATNHTKDVLDANGNVSLSTPVENRFEIEAAAELVEVPAGRFSAVRVRRVDLSDGSIKTYWYVAGLGKVKETGGQTEELVSVQLAE
jgi:hypothetical protein